MIRAALLTLSLVAAASAGHAFAAPVHDVVAINDGAGRNLVIVRGSADGRWQSSADSQIVAYTDAAGVPVRAYANYPITQREVEQRLGEAEREGRQAREEGFREAEQARIEAAQARREAAQVRSEAAQDRIEAQREARQARYEAAEARAEALADAY